MNTASSSSPSTTDSEKKDPVKNNDEIVADMEKLQNFSFTPNLKANIETVSLQLYPKKIHYFSNFFRKRNLFLLKNTLSQTRSLTISMDQKN